MLIRHVAANRTACGSDAAIVDTGEPLNGSLALVKACDRCRIGQGHTFNPTFEIGMGMNLGNASIRVNQARICGYASSDTLPSGAITVYE